MAKIVMPKNSALLDEVEAVLKIYYEAGDWLSNEEFKRQLMAMIGDNQYSSSYTKKAQITSYFGLTEWEDINNVRSLRRITPRGKSFYDHLLAKNRDGIFEDLMLSLEKTTFGRNNFGCPDSDSDVEPPILFVRAIMDLGHLTYKEFAYLLWKLEDRGGNYTDAIAEIRDARSKMIFELPEAATKYTDAKPIMVLIRWSFLAEDEISNGSKRIIINPIVLNKYRNRLLNLKVYNIDKDVRAENDQEEYDLDHPREELHMIECEGTNIEYTLAELGNILADMYAVASNKTTAIHMFGIKFGSEIKKNSFASTAIVAAANLNDSYHAELSKGLRIYDSILANEFGVKFFENSELTPRKKDILPSIPPRARTNYPLNSILYGAPGTGKTYATAQYALAIVESKHINTVSKEPRASIMSRYNNLLLEGRIVFTTFHQNYGYEDFIQGIRPDITSESMTFKTVDGIFKEIADKALKNPSLEFVIIIDEINRANISKVFGELITLIEEDKRWGEINAIEATLPSGDSIAVPNNLYIIGTMNSADKSISLIDTALRRRFVFLEYEPDINLISDDKLKSVLEKLNSGIVAELGSTDLLIGHSYLMNKTIVDLCDIMNQSIIPLLYEYFFDNQKKVEALVKKAIEGLGFEVKSSSFGRIKLAKKDDE